MTHLTAATDVCSVGWRETITTPASPAIIIAAKFLVCVTCPSSTSITLFSLVAFTELIKCSSHEINPSLEIHLFS